MKLFYATLLCCIFNLMVYAQPEKTEVAIAQTAKDTVYVDENGVVIDGLIYHKKLNSIYYFANVYDYGEHYYSQLQWTHYFGQLNDHQRQQFFKLVSAAHQIDTTKIISIHYLDTLKNESSYPKKDKIVTLPNNGHMHLYSYKSFLKQHKNCFKRYDKNKQANVYHFYSYNDGHPNVVKNMIWYEDFQKRIRLFFNKNSKAPFFILIHPDGRYFMHYRYNGIYSSDIPSNLEKNVRWDSYFVDFNNKTKVLNLYEGARTFTNK